MSIAKSIEINVLFCSNRSHFESSWLAEVYKPSWQSFYKRIKPIKFIPPFS